ncbi:MAG TPA: hypothetical protein VFA46_02555 [Actinomycetes bacterium]|nr:hypothetical protein [Actinomycetes bacterium]
MQEQRSNVGAGWVLFAGIMMIVGGFFAFFEGLGLKETVAWEPWEQRKVLS